MKNAVKYLVLSISCIICFVLSVIEVALLLDINNLTYPSTLIIPSISYVIFISGLVLLTVWAFKFSNNQLHKKFLIISLSLLITSFVVFQIGRMVNAKTTEPSKTEMQKTEYFDFDVPTIVSEIEKWDIDLTSISVGNEDNSGEKIATYSSNNDYFTTDMSIEYPPINYTITYNDKTGKVSMIYFYLDANSESAAERLLYHICSIALCIDNNEDSNKISNSITNELATSDFATYSGNNFFVTASESNSNLTAIIIP